MLKLEPGREQDARYWLGALSVNAALMRAIEATELCPGARHAERADRQGRDPGTRPRPLPR